MTSDNIGDALLARRKQRRLDQGRAAAEIGVSPSTYRSYEKNTQRPSVNVFPSLSKFLGLEIEDFLPLYAATVIFALRPALERELASQGNGSSGDGAYVEYVPSLPPPPEDRVDVGIVDVVEVDDDDFFGEPASTSDLGSVDEQVFIAVDEPSTNGDFVVEVVDVEVVDDDDDDDEDEDEDDEEEDEDEDDEDEDDVESELVSVMAREEVMATPSVSQFTSMPADFQKSTKQKKKKKKNKKR